MMNYLSPLRRIAEAVSARLCYDYLCFKGHLLDESYLTHSVSDIICTFYDPNKTVIRKGYRHSALVPFAKPKGRKPEVDYVAVDLKSKEIVSPSKLSGQAHPTAQPKTFFGTWLALNY